MSDMKYQSQVVKPSPQMEYYNRGCDLIRQKDYDGAIGVFNAALAEFPDSYYIFDRRAVAYRKKGENEKALEDYTSMIARSPENPDGWNSRGNLYHEMGEYDKAIADYTQCIPLSPPGYGTYWSNRGISYYAKGDLEAALADFNKSIETWTEPECTSWARQQRGLVLRRMGELDKAMEDFRLASIYDPDDDYAFYQAGYICFIRQDYDAAIEWYSKAVAIKGSSADNWLARGVCYWNKCGRDKINFWGEGGEIMDMAIDDFTKAIECDPGMADAYFNRGTARCAKARESNNMIKTILTQKVTDDAERALLLAQLEHIGGKALVPQVDALLRGLRSNRDDVDVLMSKGFGLFAENDAREAVEDLCRAVGLAPDNAEAYYQRGLAYTLLGERDKALSDYEQTCALNPGHEKAAGKRDELPESRK
jgi:tetratricopeptide (TPR) repeat protein